MYAKSKAIPYQSIFVALFKTSVALPWSNKDVLVYIDTSTKITTRRVQLDAWRSLKSGWSL